MGNKYVALFKIKYHNTYFYGYIKCNIADIYKINNIYNIYNIHINDIHIKNNKLVGTVTDSNNIFNNKIAIICHGNDHCNDYLELFKKIYHNQAQIYGIYLMEKRNNIPYVINKL